MKFHVALTAVLMAFLLPLSAFTASAGSDGIGLQENPDGSFSIEGDFVSLGYVGDLSPTFNSIGISRNLLTAQFEPLFESIDVQSFVPVSDPTLRGQSVRISSNEVGMEFHNNPMATMSFEAVDESLITFALEGDIGAIVDSRLARLGKGGLTAELIVQGDATLEKSFNHIRLRMDAGSRCFFRASVIPDEFIGHEISTGTVVGELYLTQIDSNVVSDLIQYQAVSLSPSFVSSEKAIVDISGDFSGGRVIVLSLDKGMFNVPADKLAVRLDGNEVARASDLDEILLGGGQSAFFASQNEGMVEVFVFVSHFSEHRIILSGGPKAVFPWDSLAVALGAAVVLLTATAYLFKKRD
ncbi:MAG: hypothetical protein ACE5QW_03135 [Thermoplasmata archaeon]